MDKSNQILKRLELLHPKKIDLSLFRLNKLLKKLGNPHLNLAPVIHVAGTNGKGSVTSYLRSIYEAANLKVHTYTSPHLIKFNERIRINSNLIENKYLNSLLEECEKKNNSDPITFFEITTAAAFLAFSRNKADLVLLETGLGGRFDATNVIKRPICNVITPISMDHMNFLGNNIQKIAFEKAGIIKSEIPIIIPEFTIEALQNNMIMAYLELSDSNDTLYFLLPGKVSTFPLELEIVYGEEILAVLIYNMDGTPGMWPVLPEGISAILHIAMVEISPNGMAGKNSVAQDLKSAGVDIANYHEVMKYFGLE